MGFVGAEDISSRPGVEVGSKRAPGQASRLELTWPTDSRCLCPPAVAQALSIKKVTPFQNPVLQTNGYPTGSLSRQEV